MDGLKNEIAYVFPGQGSQNIGMGKALFDDFPELIEIADSILSYSIQELCLSDADKFQIIQNVAKKMKLVAEDLYKLRVVNKIIGEREPATVDNMDVVCSDLEKNIEGFIIKSEKKSVRKIVRERQDKFKAY